MNRDSGRIPSPDMSGLRGDSIGDTGETETDACPPSAFSIDHNREHGEGIGYSGGMVARFPYRI
jgi:hypothetical protein